MKVCANCGNKLRKTDRFCGKCGSSMYNEVSSRAKYCLYCGQILDAKAKFCVKCGKDCDSISLSFLDEQSEVPENVELDFLNGQRADDVNGEAAEQAVPDENAEVPGETEIAKAARLARIDAEKAALEAETDAKACEEAEADIVKITETLVAFEEEYKQKKLEIENRIEEAKARAEDLKLSAEASKRLAAEKEEAKVAAEAALEEEIERLRKEEEERLRREEEERLRKEEEERLRREEEERLRREEEERLRLEEEERLRKEEEERLRREEEERLRREEEERRLEEERLRKEEEERLRREEEERRLAEEKRIKELNDLVDDAVEYCKKALAKYEKNHENGRSSLEAALDRVNVMKQKVGDEIDYSDVNPYLFEIEEIMGITYYKEGATKLAFPLIRDAAENGRKRASIYQGFWYIRNRDKIPKEPEFMVNYMNDVMNYIEDEDDELVAYGTFARIYRDGITTRKDPVKAYDYYVKAAEKGDPWGMAMVGQSLMYGDGVAKNGKEALAWNEKAALAGSEAGMRNLAICYDYGTGTKRDALKAIEWYKKLLEKMGNDRFAMYRIALCLSDPDREYGTNPTDEMLAEAYNYAEKSVQAGEVNANFVIGYLFYLGRPCQKDYANAVTYFTKAANNGNRRAKEWLTHFVRTGSGNYNFK
ncbi:MAG: zinc ribbon domain-containing protein [Lachnospiraceae bacterium]|nr:zinc ribbon domain-containing protein [Lachnospiraceae bacterium]